MDIMDNRVIMDIMDFTDIVIMIITAWMAMAGAFFPLFLWTPCVTYFPSYFTLKISPHFFQKKISTDSLSFYGQ